MISNLLLKYFYIAFFVFGISFHVFSQIKYEAENATLSSGLRIEKSISGYSGTGYVGNFANDNDKLTFRVQVSSEAYYKFVICMATPYGEKTNFISVNGNKLEFTVALSNLFQEKTIATIKLPAGENVFEITKSWGWFWVDYISVEKDNSVTADFNLTEELVISDASKNTKALYRFLLDNFQKKNISGVMTLNSFDETNWLKQQTGKEPALVGIDFLHCNRAYSWYNDQTPVNDARTWYNKNGIPALCWHWRDPSRATEEFYTEKTSFDVSKINDSNSAEYKAMISDIDYIAGLLKTLKEEDIPVLWRPLHEASGGWFWWGAKGADACKKLWQIMFDRMVNYHKLNNLIWVWTTDTKTGNLDWYPGDNYVDILGVDIYADKGDFSSQILAFDKIKIDFQGKKMVTLSECGIVPDPDKLVNDKAGWSYFMPWYGDFVQDGSYNPLDHWKKVFAHDYVITLDEMPDLRTYTAVQLISRQESASDFNFSVNRLEQIVQVKPVDINLEYEVEIYNITGRLCYKMNSQKGTLSIPVSVLPRGVILVAVKTKERRISCKLVI